jgi:hypothetical protein
MGTTTPAPGTYQYITGDTVHFSATPNAGYSFVGWEFTVGTESDTLGPQYIAAYFPANSMMSYGALTLTALFESNGTPANDSLTIHLTINDPTLGTITPAPGTYHVALNETLTITATPNAGVTFDGFTVYANGSILTNIPAQLNPFPCSVNANLLSLGEITIMAKFNDGTSAPDSLTLILNTDDPTMGTTNPAPGTYHFAVGDTSYITAVPNPGYSFLYWIETVAAAGMSVSDTLYADTVISVINQMMANMTLSLTAYFEVSSAEPCETPTNLHASTFDAHSITIGWNNNGNATSWNIRYRVENGEWSSANTTTNTYVITGLQAETLYEIEVQANCGNGNLSDWSEPIHIMTAPDGIESWLESSVSLYPNPAREYVDIRIDGDVNVKSMEVYDVYGKLINTVNVIDNPTRINVSNLANGMYFVRVTTEEGAVTKTFVKK